MRRFKCSLVVVCSVIVMLLLVFLSISGGVHSSSDTSSPSDESSPTAEALESEEESGQGEAEEIERPFPITPSLAPGAILRHHTASKYEPSIAVIDRPHLAEFAPLKETQLFTNGTRLLVFGLRATQSGVATVAKPPPGATNESFPLQPLNYSAPPVFRYITAMSLVVPFWEIRAWNNNHGRCRGFSADELTCKKPNRPKVSEHAKSLLVVGLGSGSIIKHIKKVAPTLRKIDAIELDPVVVQIARDFFEFEDGVDANVTVGDAAKVLGKDGPLEHEKYDIIIVDCASSFNGDKWHPLFPKVNLQQQQNQQQEEEFLPEISQPLSCHRESFLRNLHDFHVANYGVSVVAFNFLGILEPLNAIHTRPLRRFIKTIEQTWRKSTPVIHPTFFRKWAGGFASDRLGHSHARAFDNLVIFVTDSYSYDPKRDDLLLAIEKDLNQSRAEGRPSRYSGIASDERFLFSMVKNRYSIRYHVETEVPLPEKYTPRKKRAGERARLLRKHRKQLEQNDHEQVSATNAGNEEEKEQEITPEQQ